MPTIGITSCFFAGDVRLAVLDCADFFWGGLFCETACLLFGLRLEGMNIFTLVPTRCQTRAFHCLGGNRIILAEKLGVRVLNYVPRRPRIISTTNHLIAAGSFHDQT